MTITVTALYLGSTPSQAGTAIGSQAIAAPSTWTKLTTLGTFPPGGARISAVSDAEPFRISLSDPLESSNPSGPDVVPRDNGVLVPWPAGQAYEEMIPVNGQVWVKQA